MFNVTSINLPEDLQEALDKRIAIGMSGDLNKYTQYQVANAVPLAAQNEGGLAGVGAGLSAGVVARLGQLKSLLDKGLISAGDFDAAKAEVLKKLVG